MCRPHRLRYAAHVSSFPEHRPGSSSSGLVLRIIGTVLRQHAKNLLTHAGSLRPNGPCGRMAHTLAWPIRRQGASGGIAGLQARPDPGDTEASIRPDGKAWGQIDARSVPPARSSRPLAFPDCCTFPVRPAVRSCSDSPGGPTFPGQSASADLRAFPDRLGAPFALALLKPWPGSSNQG